MRYLFAVIDHEGNPGSDTEMADIDVFNAGLEAAGQLLMAVGIAGLKTATVFDNRQGAGIVTAGPVNDTREYMSGFWVVDIDDHDEAMRLAAQGSRACNRKVEVRALL